MLIPPTKATLSRYGLTLEAWTEMADAQNHACAICKSPPEKGRLHIEHEHVRMWRHMEPSDRVKFVRCLACFQCNTQYMGKGLNLEKAKALVVCLEAYYNRRPTKLPKPLPKKKRKAKRSKNKK